MTSRSFNSSLHFSKRATRALGLGLAAAMLSLSPLAVSSALAQQQAPPPPDGYADPGQGYNDAPDQGYPDQGQMQAANAQPGYPAQPQGQPLSDDQLDQLVAPIALYPDALVAQVLAAATYPTQVVEADRWRQAQGNASPDQIAAAANNQTWDPSVKALTAFPTVLQQMDQNLRWTTDLGNAYYNQPQDVMASIQSLRQRAQAAGNLQNTQQQTVTYDDGAINIAPASPDVVYVPYYDPWYAFGAPLGVYPGFFWGPPVGYYYGGWGIGWGWGINIGFYRPWGWGWGHWGCGWRSRSVVYNHSNYVTHSTTVVNRGFSRPGGPPAGSYGRGSFANRGGANGFHGNGGYGNGGFSNRGGSPAMGLHTEQGARPGGSGTANSFNRGGSNPSRPGFTQPTAPTINRGNSGSYQGYSGYEGNSGYRGGYNGGNVSHPSMPSRPSGGGYSGGGHVSSGGGGGHVGGGGGGGGHAGGGHR